MNVKEYEREVIKNSIEDILITLWTSDIDTVTLVETLIQKGVLLQREFPDADVPAVIKDIAKSGLTSSFVEIQKSPPLSDDAGNVVNLNTRRNR